MIHILKYLGKSMLELWRRQWHPTPVLLLENPRDGGAWWAAVHGVAESRTLLSDLAAAAASESRGFPCGSVVKNPPAVQEIQVQSLGGEDPLEEGVAAHTSILAWRISWTEEPGGLWSIGSQRVRHDYSN